MAKRFTTIAAWESGSTLPKRIKQALLWTIATGNPESESGPVLAALAMAGALGLTKDDLQDILGVDCYPMLMQLRKLGAVERGAGGTFTLKTSSTLLSTGGEVTKCHLVRPKKPTKKAKKKLVSQRDSLYARTRTHAHAPAHREYTHNTQIPDSSDTDRSDLDQDQNTKRKRDQITRSATDAKPLGGVAGRLRAKKKKPGRKSYKEQPSKRPQQTAWKKRPAHKWDASDCLGYWLHRYVELYEIEDPQMVGATVKTIEKFGFAILSFLRSDDGLRGEVGHWKEYVDFLFSEFLPSADWLTEPMDLQQAIRLPRSGDRNYFLLQWRKSKAKVPKRKKKKLVTVRHPWGYEPRYVDED